MAKVDYDGFAGLNRLTDAERTVDQRAAIILTFHAALEREIDVVLTASLPRPEKLRRGFGFANKIDVLAAAWKGDQEAGDKLHLVLRRFNDLRNSVAHDDEIADIERWLMKLLEAYRAIYPDVDIHVEIDEVAQGICCFMSDVPDMRATMEMIAAVNRAVRTVNQQEFSDQL